MERGAWIEQTEVEINVYCDDDTRKHDGKIEELAEFSHDMGAAYGTDFRIADRMATEMKAAGFVEIKEAKYKLPLGPWSADPRYKEIGKFYERYYKTGLQGWLMHILTTTFQVCRLQTLESSGKFTHKSSGAQSMSTRPSWTHSRRSTLANITITSICECC
jgi:hypothetical protein